MLRAITFDLWETLIHEDQDLDDKRRDYRVNETFRILSANKIKIDKVVLDEAHQSVIARMHAFWGSNMDASVIEQTKIFLEAAAGGSLEGKLPAPALLEIARHYGEAAIHYPPKPADGVRAVLDDARSRGLQLGLICNTGRTPGKVLRDLLQKMDLRDSFDALYFSDEVRIRKPGREIFEKALLRFGCPPQEALHVGDRIETDILGAKAAGMISVHLRAPGMPGGTGEPDFTIETLGDLKDVLNQVAHPPGYKTRSIKRDLGETRHD